MKTAWKSRRGKEVVIMEIDGGEKISAGECAMTPCDGDKKILEIPVDLLDDHPKNNHVFGINEEELEPLVVSIRALGVLQPLTVKKKGDGRYMITAGHRRKYASIKAGLKTVPCYVLPDGSDGAEDDLMLAEANLNFRQLSPMNIARAIRLEMEALGISRGGDRKSERWKSEREKSKSKCQTLIEKFKMSKGSIYLYDSLNDLIPELQEMVDSGAMTLTLASKLGGLAQEAQRELYQYLGDDIKHIEPGYVAKLKEQNDRGYLVLEVMQKKIKELEAELEERRRKEGDIADLERRIQALRSKKRTLEYDLADYANAAVRAREKLLNNGAALLGVVEELVRPLAGAKPKIEALLEHPIESGTATHLLKWAQVLLEVGRMLDAAAKNALVVQGDREEPEAPGTGREERKKTSKRRGLSAV